MTAWMSVGYDAARLEPLTGTLTETGGGGATGSVSMTGRYAHWIYSDAGSDSGVVDVDPVYCDVNNTVSVDVGGYRNFGVELESALNAIGNATYTVTFDPTVDRYTIAASGGGVTAFTISSMTGSMRRMVGMNGTSLSSSALSWSTPTNDPVGRRIMHWVRPDCGGWSEWSEVYQDIDGEALVGADGSPRGLTALGSPLLVDFVAPWEPLEKIYEIGPTSVNYAGSTWQAVFSRARCAEPIWISPAESGSPYTDDIAPSVCFMRPDSAVLRPRKASADYLSHQSIPFGMFKVGRGLWYNQV